MLIYDCEIVKAIPPKNDADRVPGIEYCSGWNDHANMGISCICAYDYIQLRYRVFLEDSFKDFEKLISNRLVVGFNSLGFDDRLCQANGLEVRTEYDLLVEIWRSAGLEPPFRYPSHTGYGLDDVAKANGFSGKSGHGALAPIDWQKGKRGAVIDYCLEDIRQTKSVLDRILARGELLSPKDPGRILKIRRP